MLLYRLCKRNYAHEPLSAEGARRAGGRWNGRGVPLLYTSATPELALLEVLAHLNPAFVPQVNLIVLDVAVEDARVYTPAQLPRGWQEGAPTEQTQQFLGGWLTQPDVLAVALPSALMPRSYNYLLHSAHPAFLTAVRIVENVAFAVDGRLV